MYLLQPLDKEDVRDFRRFSLKTVSLDDRPDYDALSYEWERQVDASHNLPRCIVNGVEIYPKRNLLLAISVIPMTVIWIDAICINQADDREREAQVQMMYQIYRNALTVKSWLGQEEDNIALAMGLISWYADKFRTKRLKAIKTWTMEGLDDVKLSPHWDAFSRFCQRSYW